MTLLLEGGEKSPALLSVDQVTLQAASKSFGAEVQEKRIHMTSTPRALSSPMKSGGSQPCLLPGITWVLIKILMSGAQGFHFNWFWWQPGYWFFFFLNSPSHP